MELNSLDPGKVWQIWIQTVCKYNKQDIDILRRCKVTLAILFRLVSYHN